MRYLFLTLILCVALAVQVSAQDPTPSPQPTATPETSTPAATPDANTPAATTQTSTPADTPDQSTPAVQANNNWYTRPDSKTRFKRYVNSMFGPMAIAQTAAVAGLGTWRNSPEEWGDQWEGFGRRFASGMGRSAIKQTTIYGLGEALKLDSKYYRSQKKDVGSKIRNALISPVTARRPNGKRTIGIPRIVGTYTSSIVAAEWWLPARYDYKDGLKAGTISLAWNVAWNLVKEFVWK